MKIFTDLKTRLDNSKAAAKILKWSGILVLAVAAIAILYNYCSSIAYLLSEPDRNSLGRLLIFRAESVIIFTSVWLLSWKLNKKLMVLVWLAAFGLYFHMSLIVPEYCWDNAESYCRSHDCETQSYYSRHCF